MQKVSTDTATTTPDATTTTVAPTTAAPTTTPASNKYTTRCGETFEKAQNKCGRLCVSQDSECHGSEKCYADLDAKTCTDMSTVNRCGDGWEDAAGKCGKKCANVDLDCPVGEQCFALADYQEPCNNPIQTTTAPTQSNTQSGSDTTQSQSLSSYNGKKRIVAYVPNWTECPTASMLEHYTHAMIAFIVTYPTWLEHQDNCHSDHSCTVQDQHSGCMVNGQYKTLKKMVSDLQDAGLKVILSFGGAAMGGSWETTNTCWEHCLDKVDHLVDGLDALVKSTGADGLDVDYEYHTEKQKYKTFLNELIVKLDQKMGDKDVLLTHAPMDSDLCDTSFHSLCSPEYRDILAAHADKVWFCFLIFRSNFLLAFFVTNCEFVANIHTRARTHTHTHTHTRARAHKYTHVDTEQHTHR